ncbi:cupin domain-containing protein [Pectinatus brassicae]|uniref:AraC-like DNA-binding protein n=1 Tax=Pectinatus brassicae TaxID=862415 RepID=A0A840UTG3_9FIRM|nr:cupin domain-containing protein [Pectinatus brassicae]MBB5337422.1 AraC-like DNA-binding protein [Pectinatus brassicae]
MFINENFQTIFKDSFPKLISIYEAKGQYTQIPRAMHLHEKALEFIFIIDGYGMHIIDGKKYYTEKGDLLILNAGILHDESAIGTNLCIATCAMNNLKINGFLNNTLLKKNQSPLLKTGDNYFKIKSLFHMMYEASIENNNITEEYINYLLRALVVLIYGIEQDTLDNTNNNKENILAQKIKTYIDEKYMEDLKLNAIAENLYISMYYLSHVFKKKLWTITYAVCDAQAYRRGPNVAYRYEEKYYRYCTDCRLQ